MSENNVIDFDDAKAAIQVTNVQMRLPAIDDCRHRNLVVDERNRIVTCKDCEQQIDPILVLIEFAYQQRRLEYTHEALAKRETEVKKRQRCIECRKKIGDERKDDE